MVTRSMRAQCPPLFSPSRDRWENGAPNNDKKQSDTRHRASLDFGAELVTNQVYADTALDLSCAAL